MSARIYYFKINGNVQPVEFTFEPNVVNEKWENIPADQFLSVQEIADHQMSTIGDEDRKFFSTVDKSDLIMMHHSYGQWIRNTYGLWHKNNPFVIPGDPGDGHPDGLSMLVIEEIYKRCSAKNNAYDHAMSII
jgi:hypothetical protein